MGLDVSEASLVLGNLGSIDARSFPLQDLVQIPSLLWVSDSSFVTCRE